MDRVGRRHAARKAEPLRRRRPLARPLLATRWARTTSAALQATADCL
jgi:hypothetical protein